MTPGTSLTECFSPQFGFLTGISIGVKREENDNTLIGRLLDDEGKVLAESYFTLKDTDYSFCFTNGSIRNANINCRSCSLKVTKVPLW